MPDTVGHSIPVGGGGRRRLFCSFRALVALKSTRTNLIIRSSLSMIVYCSVWLYHVKRGGKGNRRCARRRGIFWRWADCEKFCWERRRFPLCRRCVPLVLFVPLAAVLRNFNANRRFGQVHRYYVILMKTIRQRE